MSLRIGSQETTLPNLLTLSGHAMTTRSANPRMSLRSTASSEALGCKVELHAFRLGVVAFKQINAGAMTDRMIKPRWLTSDRLRFFFKVCSRKFPIN